MKKACTRGSPVGKRIAQWLGMARCCLHDIGQPEVGFLYVKRQERPALKRVVASLKGLYLED